MSSWYIFCNLIEIICLNFNFCRVFFFFKHRDELDLETEEDGARHRNDLEAGSSSSESDDQESSESEDEEEIQDQDGQNDEGDEQDEQEATEAPPPVSHLILKWNSE